MFEEYSKLENRGSDEKILFLIFDLFFRVESPPLRDVKERKEILVLSRSIDFNLRKQFERQLEHPRRRTSQLHGAGAERQLAILLIFPVTHQAQVLATM